MITVTETIPSFETFSETLGYEPSGSLFFDIETTGFSPSSSLLFLVGTLELQEETWKLTQYLAEHPDDERRIVEAFFTSASRHSTLLHFNGSTFDLPYLTKKAAHYGISHTLGQTASVDLYQKFRPLGKLLPLTQKNQKAFEEFLGWRHSDRLIGKHMLSLFPKFAASAEPELCSLLLGHNHDDMIGMTKLLPMAAYLELLDGTGADAVSAFCASAGSGPYQDREKILNIDFSLKHCLPKPFAADADFRLTASGSSGQLQIPLWNGTLCYFFADYKNYYYLPLEDQAVHKSVARFVDKQYRIPAKASNCYIKKSGVFLPQPEEIFTPAFRRSFEDTKLYFEYTDAFCSDAESIQRYLAAMLRHLL